MSTPRTLHDQEVRSTYRDLVTSALGLRQAIAHLSAAGWETNAAELGEALLTVEAAMTGIEGYSIALGVDL